MARSDFRQSARTRSAGLKRLIWLAVFVLVISSFAGEPWDKRPEQWNLAETYQILSDSPWSPAKTAVELTFEKRYIDPLTNRRVELPTQTGPPRSSARNLGDSRNPRCPCCGGRRRRCAWRSSVCASCATPQRCGSRCERMS